MSWEHQNVNVISTLHLYICCQEAKDKQIIKFALFESVVSVQK